MTEPREVDATRRTRLANERTFLAWLRSALAAAAVAIGVGRILPGVAHVTHWPFELLGALFGLLAAMFAVVGVRRYAVVERAFTRGEFVPLALRTAYVLAAVTIASALLALGLIFLR